MAADTSCEIYVINHPNPEAGKIVRGIVDFCIERPTQFSNITVYLIGKSHFEIVKGCRYIAQSNRASDEFLRLTKDALDGDKTKVFEPGSHAIDFQFEVPNELPSSTFEIIHTKREHGYWKNTYYIQVIFDCVEECVQYQKPFILNNVMPLDPKALAYAFNHKLFTPFWKKAQTIRVTSQFSYTRLQPGQAIEFEYNINNDSDVNIKKAITQMICRKTLTVRDKRKHVIDEVVCKGYCNDAIEKRSSHAIRECLVSSKTAATIWYSRIIKVDYIIKIELVLPFPHKNIICEIPLVIGHLDFNDTEIIGEPFGMMIGDAISIDNDIEVREDDVYSFNLNAPDNPDNRDNPEPEYLVVLPIETEGVVAG